MAIHAEDKKTGSLPGVPKRRGRPLTGSAKTAAQRQAESRRRRQQEGNGIRQVSASVSTSAALALARLAKHQGMTKAQVLERLLVEADDAILKTIEPDTKEWDDYFK